MISRAAIAGSRCAAIAARRQQIRGLSSNNAAKYKAKQGLVKNKYCEEWNGLREDTAKHFEVTT